MRARASILHLDLDAFFASVEQRDKPSLRGKAVIVGGVGQRGVVSTASYEARVFGVHSAMPSHEARRRCPHAAFLSGRFDAYREASRIVMGLLRELSPVIEPLSLDEAFVDLERSELTDFDTAALTARVDELKAELAARTGGLTASVGVASSKFMAKVASELAKPSGCVVVEPGTEVALIAPMPIRTIPGVGPVTAQKLQQVGITKIADVQRLGESELHRLLGASWGTSLYALAHARDDRAVESEREAKSVSVEDTYERDLTDRGELAGLADRYARHVAARIQKFDLFARTVQIKVKFADFSIHTRSRTLAGATDQPDVISTVARSLLDGVDVSPGVRLLGVGVAGLASVAQEALFLDEPAEGAGGLATASNETSTVRPGRFAERRRVFPPGCDVIHDEFGRGWVWGSGLGRVTVRFETADTGPGPVRSFAVDDEALHLWQLPTVTDAGPPEV